MITYKSGNLLNDDADILVNTVNCVGVMGKGIALAFKQHYPEMGEWSQEKPYWVSKSTLSTHPTDENVKTLIGLKI